VRSKRLNLALFPPLVDATKRTIYAARLKHNTAWTRVRDRARQRQQDLQDFKNENMLKRDCVDHPLILAIGICAIAFVIESAVNAVLLQEVSRWGLAGGAINAMTLSGPNLVLGLTAGIWGLRARNHIKPLIHHSGSIVTVLSLCLAVAWNLIVGHVRLHAEYLSHTRQELRLSDWQPVRAQIFADPTAPFMSAPAVVLMLLGLVVLTVALFDGLYGFADPYPGFSRVDRRNRRAQRDVIATKKIIFRTLRRLTRRGVHNINHERRSHQRKAREGLRILENARGVIIKFQSRIDDKAWAYDECLAEYQALNARHREHVPARFPDYSGERPEVRQNFRHEHPALAALVEYATLLAILLGLILVLARLWKFARR
jgi:hypothetical protein